MKANIGSIDKILRIVVGIALIAWGLLSANYFGAIGLILLATGLASRCPIYSLTGIKTCSATKD